MVKVTIYVEGGGDSKELQILCRKGFRKLFEDCGFSGRMPRIFACGGRSAAFDDFKTALASVQDSEFVAMLIDSEQPLSNLGDTWQHLAKHEGWQRPQEAVDEQVIFMTTCMETWIVADRAALRRHFGQSLKITVLPPLEDLESRDRHFIQESLKRATQDCQNAYRKGKRSFAALETLSPDTLQLHLPSFARARRILQERL